MASTGLDWFYAIHLQCYSEFKHPMLYCHHNKYQESTSSSQAIQPKWTLWMDKILHHFETMGNHCLLVFTGNQTIPGLLRWCRILSIHSMATCGFEVVGTFLWVLGNLAPDQRKNILEAKDYEVQAVYWPPDEKRSTQLFSGTLFPFFSGGCPTKNGPQKVFLFFSRVTG